MGIAYNTSIVRDGLVLHLDAANVKSYPGTGSVWKDVSGNGNDGSIINLTFNEDGFICDGATSNRVVRDIIDAMSLTDGTLSFVFKMGSTASDRDIFNIGTHSTNNPSLIWFDKTVGAGDFGTGNSNCLSCMVYDGSVQHWVSTPSNSIESGKTYVLDVVFDNSTMKVYVNGKVLAQNDKACNGIQSTTKEMTFCAGGGGTNSFDGEFYNSRLYAKALSENEVKQNFNALRGRYGI